MGRRATQQGTMSSLGGDFLRRKVLGEGVLLRHPFVRLFQSTQRLRSTLGLQHGRRVSVRRYMGRQLSSRGVPHRRRFFFFLVPSNRNGRSAGLLRGHQAVDLGAVRRHLHIQTNSGGGLLFPFRLLPRFLMVVSFSIGRRYRILATTFRELRTTFRISSARTTGSGNRTIVCGATLHV